MPFQKIISVSGDYCNSFRQVPFSDLGQARQVFRGILPTRNHDVGDFLLKTDHHNLPITHGGTRFFTLWVNHHGPVVSWSVIKPVFSSVLRLVIATLVGDLETEILGSGAEEECTVPPTPSPLHYDF